MAWSPATGANPGLPGERGTITSWSHKGFGFISSDAGGEDLFLYSDNIRDLDMKVKAKNPAMGLQRGARVAFDVQRLQGSIRRGKDAGKRRALAVHVVPLPADQDIHPTKRANSTREAPRGSAVEEKTALKKEGGRGDSDRDRSSSEEARPQRWKSRSRSGRRGRSRERERSRGRDRRR